jgi:hypothetical protein
MDGVTGSIQQAFTRTTADTNQRIMAIVAAQKIVAVAAFCLLIAFLIAVRSPA